MDMCRAHRGIFVFLKLGVVDVRAHAKGRLQSSESFFREHRKAYRSLEADGVYDPSPFYQCAFAK